MVLREWLPMTDSERIEGARCSARMIRLSIQCPESLNSTNSPSRALDVDKLAIRDFERLMADPRLAELNELQRGASDALDLIELSENQNSVILAWLFDSREGHGQGDEILRDLLLHASKRAMELKASDPHTQPRGLDRQSMTRRFFERWTPSRIRTTSFGGAFPVREFGFNRENRTDLAVIDEQNQLIVVVENKTKTKHTDGQLNRYREDFEDAVAKNKRLSKFVIAFIAMSEHFDYGEEAMQPCPETWLHVGYGWLKPSADRAVRQVERGNMSARLVASYCTLRTQWEDPLDHDRTLKAAGLLRDYPEAIAHLRTLMGPKMTADWFQHEEKANPLMLFVLQNRATAQLLAKLQGTEALAARARSLLSLGNDDGVEWGKNYVSIRAPRVEHLGIDDYWVSYFNVVLTTPNAVEAGKGFYDVVLAMKPEKFRSRADEERLRKQYEAVNNATFAGTSARICRSVLASGLEEDDALWCLQRHYRALA